MKSLNINGLNSIQQARPQQPESVRPKDAEALAPSVAHSTPDQVNVSSREKEVGRLMARTGEFGDVRHERVYLLQQFIQSDQYNVSSSNIADAILRDEGGWQVASNAWPYLVNY